MEFVAEFKNYDLDSDGNISLTFCAKSVDKVDARKCAVRLQTRQETDLQVAKTRYRVEVNQYREKRSLNSNAYFHTLVDKIAKILGIGKTECKRMMVLEYGTIAEAEGEQLIVALPKSANANDIYPYAKWIGDFKAKNGRMYSQYIFYKQTHTLDRAEMAKLIDGVVQEAKALDIETLAPAQIAEMNKLWEPCNEE